MLKEAVVAQFKVLYRLFLEGLRKTKKPQSSWSPGRDLNPELPKYEAEVLTIRPRRARKIKKERGKKQPSVWRYTSTCLEVTKKRMKPLSHNSLSAKAIARTCVRTVTLWTTTLGRNGVAEVRQRTAELSFSSATDMAGRKWLKIKSA
jgi:hypothetical protein